MLKSNYTITIDYESPLLYPGIVFFYRGGPHEFT